LLKTRSPKAFGKYSCNATDLLFATHINARLPGAVLLEHFYNEQVTTNA
jgi:hypothetical protein